MRPDRPHLVALSLAFVVGVSACAALAAGPPGAKSLRGPIAQPTDDLPASDVAESGTEVAAPRVFLRAQFDDIIDDGELAALRMLSGVTEVAAPRRDDGALWSSRLADGTPVDDLPYDFKVSVALEVDRPELALDLAAGEVALTEAGRAHRDLDVGSTVELSDRVDRTVVEVTDDPRLRDVEFVVAAQDAAVLDVRARQRALLSLAPTADVDVVVTAVQAVVGPDVIVDVRTALDRPMVLPLPETKARFGEFAFRDLPGRDVQIGVSWIEEHVVEARLPIIGQVRCHRLVVDDLTAVFEDIEAAGLADEIDPDLYGGCWSPRRINRNANLSRHAWGIAIDINVDFDAPGLGPIPSEEVIEAFERHGFRWGGDYPIPDNHHFEFVGDG